MNTQRLLGCNLSRTERTLLENHATSLEVLARSLPATATVTDEGNNEVTVRNYLFGLAWDMKCIARVGTTSYNL